MLGTMSKVWIHHNRVGNGRVLRSWERWWVWGGRVICGRVGVEESRELWLYQVMSQSHRISPKCGLRSLWPNRLARERSNKATRFNIITVLCRSKLKACNLFIYKTFLIDFSKKIVEIMTKIIIKVFLCWFFYRLSNKSPTSKLLN